MLNGENPSKYPAPGSPGSYVGTVVGGSLNQGVEVRLDSQGETAIEDIKAGTFLTINGGRNRFFGVVTDLALSSADPRVRHTPPEPGDDLMLQILSGKYQYCRNHK